MKHLHCDWKSALAALFVVGILPAQAQFSETLSGFYESDFDGGGYTVRESMGFECTGSPTCTGTYFSQLTFGGNCASDPPIVLSGPIALSGLSTTSTTVSGTLSRNRPALAYRADGSPKCATSPSGETIAQTVPFSGPWSATDRSGSFDIPANRPYGVDRGRVYLSGYTGFPALFGLFINSLINANVWGTATLQIPVVDLGKLGSVYTFASMPLSGATGSEAPLGKADAASCALVQLDASGKPFAASTLQPSFTGTFGSAPITVTLADKVPVASLAGATFYVGYGADPQAMFRDRRFQKALQVPGGKTCPMLPYATGLWWNPAEAGWGVNLVQQGKTLFGTLFAYDQDRKPTWLVMSNGVLQDDGQMFIGDLYRTSGPAFDAQPFTPIGASNLTKVGTMSVLFRHQDWASLSYSVGDTYVMKEVQRQVYGSRAVTCTPTASASRAPSRNYQDLWWNAAESGWGLNLTHQDDTLFGTLFTYDAAGKPLWLVMSAGQKQPDGSYQGGLYRTSGTPFGAKPFVPVAPADVAQVGSMRLQFADGDHGTLTYTYAGSTVTKAITRQAFSSPVSTCE